MQSWPRWQIKDTWYNNQFGGFHLRIYLNRKRLAVSFLSTHPHIIIIMKSYFKYLIVIYLQLYQWYFCLLPIIRQSFCQKVSEVEPNGTKHEYVNQLLTFPTRRLFLRMSCVLEMITIKKRLCTVLVKTEYVQVVSGVKEKEKKKKPNTRSLSVVSACRFDRAGGRKKLPVPEQYL